MADVRVTWTVAMALVLAAAGGGCRRPAPVDRTPVLAASTRIGWRQVSPASPTPRYSALMTYDSVRNRAVLFGGYFDVYGSFGGTYSDTWEWNGSTATWTQGSPTTSPPPLAAPYGAIVFDPNRARTILIGAKSLWEWDGDDWTDRTPSPLPAVWPAGVTGQGAVYDAARGVVVVAGSGLWELDPASATWTERGAGGLSDGALVYDSGGGRNRVLSFHWLSVSQWNPTAGTWTSLPSTPPVMGDGPRNFATFTYDPVRDRVVAYGGKGSSGLTTADVWEWDPVTSAWASRGPASGLVRQTHAITFDAVRGRLITIGGTIAYGSDTFGSTWELGASLWTQLVGEPDTKPVCPSGICFHGSTQTWDATRGKVVGWSGGHMQESDDAGKTWVDRTPTPLPTPWPTGGTFLVGTDAGVLLYGGGIDTNELWLWNGTSQTFSQLASSPKNGAPKGGVWDPVRGVLVVTSSVGTCEYAPTPGTWSCGNYALEGLAWDTGLSRMLAIDFNGAAGIWNGTTLTPLPGVDTTQFLASFPPLAPVPWQGLRTDPGFAYDSVRHQAVLFGGRMAWEPDPYMYYYDTWRLGCVGTNCPGELGSSCTGAGQCDSGICSRGVCCNADCAGACKTCESGVCGNLPRLATDPGLCEGASACNGFGACLKTNAESCTGAGDCASGACVDLVCCSTACLGVCTRCDQAGHEGVCTPLAAGTDPDRECTKTGACGGTCSGSGTCFAAPSDGGCPDAGADAARPPADARTEAAADGPPSSDDSGAPDVPAATDAPAANDAPGAIDAPVTADAPAANDAPGTTDAPVAADAPGAADAVPGDHEGGKGGGGFCAYGRRGDVSPWAAILVGVLLMARRWRSRGRSGGHL